MISPARDLRQFMAQVPGPRGRLSLRFSSGEPPALGARRAFAEDKSRIRTNNGPQQLATTRNAAIVVCRANNDPEIAAARRDFAWNPSRLFAILGFLKK